MKAPLLDAPLLSIDLGGTNFRMALVDVAGNIVRMDKVPTSSESGLEGTLRELQCIVDPTSLATGVVCGAPGPVDYVHNRVIYAPNIPQEWIEHLNGAHLSEVLGVPVRIVNDADLAATGEYYLGAGRGNYTIVYVTISTGVGAGVVSHGRIVRTRYSISELGHTYLDPERALNTGEGSVEWIASGSGLRRRAEAAGIVLPVDFQPGEEDRLSDPARVLLSEVTRDIAVALADTSFMFSPDALVIGGGLLNSGLITLEGIGLHFERVRPSYLDIKLLRAELGDLSALRAAPFVKAALPPDDVT